ncbi:MAG TPA: HipA N-terminal domain-containing protein [Bacteroidales bacterium]|nr:HipA N-terminal domain-containing protein [Bacteroidales bacterium]
MIEKIKKILWKIEGMDFIDNPADSKGEFHLKYETLLVGSLTYDGKKWTFKYSEDYKESNLQAIIDFPKLNKEYESNQLWPFFASRIPALNQPFQFKKIEKAKIDKNDSVALLKLFGNKTITNPFKLLPV